MYIYQFKCGSFFFKLVALNDEAAIKRAQHMLEESFPEDSIDHLDINLTDGGFSGRLYIDTETLSVSNIHSKERVPELDVTAPF